MSTECIVIIGAIATVLAGFGGASLGSIFAYKTGMSWWVFALAGILFLSLTLISPLYHVLKTAGTNTSESLRYE